MKGGKRLSFRPMQKILIHFGELSLKGKNRSHFERKMANNLKKLLRPAGVQRQHGRMLLDMEHVDEQTIELLKLIPGIRNFALVRVADTELESMQQVARQVVIDTFGEDVAGIPFRVEARRGDKNFPMKSMEINFEVGGYLKTQLDLAVNLSNPQITVYVEVTQKGAYIYTNKINGIGGLPVGSSGKGVVLFSGGIDSPVAAYTMIKRGMEVTLVHLFNSTINRDFAKIRDLARQLSRYQGSVKLVMIDLEEFQRHAIASVPPKYRMIIYKRQMIRSAALVAEEIGAQALVTGDSLGQVASQTLANINAIYDASPLPLLSPLMGYDKEEIIHLARRIGTYEISIEEYCDICSFLIAKHPETQGKRGEVAELEKMLPLEGIDYPRREARFFAGEELTE